MGSTSYFKSYNIVANVLLTIVSLGQWALGRSAAGALPTFANLGDEAAGTVLGQLSAGRGGYTIAGQLADGSYDFVVQAGTVIVGKGHAALAGGARVTYAGEATFRVDNSWNGRMRPAISDLPPSLLGNAGLPMKAFRAVKFPGFVGGPQLPVFQ
jgi:hypothetical protein